MKIIKPSIVLVRPQLPENIGMVARAMDNFGLKVQIMPKMSVSWLISDDFVCRENVLGVMAMPK